MLFASTIFVSAFLLFLLQPLIAREILPWFGGSAAVWTLCLVFFQVVLLLGYVYADRLSRRPLRTQAMVHTALLLLACAMLPVIPDAAWKPAGGADPVLAVLAVLSVTVGLPYLAVCTTGPLVQSWVARLHAEDPVRQARVYRLFALSNLAALVALVVYPFVLEPAFPLRTQAIGWSAGFGLFTLLAIASVWVVERVLRSPRLAAVAAVTAQPLANPPPPPEWRDQVLWLVLSALGTVALLSISTYITQDLASVPLLWILPLALYLLSFVLCFDSARGYSRRVFWPAVLAVAPLLGWYIIMPRTSLPIAYAIGLFCLGLFVICMFCNGELAKSRPAPDHLTRFYLMMALGGALGGLFAGVAAPQLFNGNWELPASLAMPGLIVLWLARVRWPSNAWRGNSLRVIAGVLGALGSVAVVALTLGNLGGPADRTLLRARNFYGVLRVEQFGSDRSTYASRRLLNGVISHGEQALAADKRKQPVTYYGPQSGAGLAISARGLSRQRIGVIGLGIGTLAAYGRAGDTYRFYEINPLVIQAAHTHFTYLTDTTANIEIAQGDARLVMQHELDTAGSQNFDVIVVDAFSGDAIPVHLMTREALRIYRRHLRPGGVIAFHVSNRHLELEPVVKRLAEDAGMQARLIDFEPPLGSFIEHTSSYVLLAQDEAWFSSKPEIASRAEAIGGTSPLWTDDYSNLLAAMRWHTR
jgi:SAM-dependent methyltransferase